MMAKSKLHIAVLISGNGSNLQAIIDAQAQYNNYEISLVLSNRHDAYGLQRAALANLPCEVVARSDYTNRGTFDAALTEKLQQYSIDLIVLAGFMHILDDKLVSHYAGRMINIHPSLLPKYRGLHTYEKALANGDVEHGTSVHFVTAELDGGPIIAQAKCPVMGDDSAESLQTRVQQLEHRLYPQVISWFASQRLQLRDEGVVFDEQLLPRTGKIYSTASLSPTNDQP